MFRFIGGPARCGKSTLAKQVDALHAGQMVSLDNLRHAFVPLATKTVQKTLLVAPKHTKYDAGEWLNILRQRDATSWKGIKAYLVAAGKNDDDVLMEGCVWPDYISELDDDYRAVFLVDTSPNHANRLIAAARGANTHNNWHSEKTDEWIRGWAEYNIARSKLYKKLAQAHGQPVFDVADGGMQQAQDAALAYLFPDDIS